MHTDQILQRLFTALEKHISTRDQAGLVEYISPEELRDVLNLNTPGTEGDWEKIFTWIEQYLHYGVATSHPAFVNRMWAGANLPSILGEMVVAATNTSSCTFESAPVSTLLEKYMIQQMLDQVGFTHGEGQMTSGSSNANMIAMLCARNTLAATAKAKGLLHGSRQLYGFVQAEAHYSMDKAANILGIGTDHLIKIEINSRGEMVPELLEQAIIHVLADGGLPFFVAATLGTTVRGAYDPLPPLVELKKEYGFWVHGDGAWGGAAIMSDRLREQFMPGLNEIDSFTCDFHKMLGSSLMCNVLLLNNSVQTFCKTLTAGDGSYLFRGTDDNDVDDLGSLSLQCGRRVDSLKWFLDWKYYGKSGFCNRVEKYLQLCKYAEQVIHETPELEMVTPRVSFNICFQYTFPAKVANSLNEQLRTELYHRGTSLVGLADVGRKRALRLLIANTNIDKRSIDQFFKKLVSLGRELEIEEKSDATC